jgi:hypothetical protein
MTTLDMRQAVVRLKSNRKKGVTAMNKITALMILLSVAMLFTASQAFAASSGWPTSPNNYYNGYYNTLPPKVAAVPTPEKVCAVDYGTPGHVSKYVTSSDPELARTPGYPQVQMASVPSTCQGISVKSQENDLRSMHQDNPQMWNSEYSH